MQAVNLLPRDAVASERSRINAALIGGGATPIIALALVIVGYSSAHRQVETQISELSILNAQVAELAPAKVRAEAQAQERSAATNQLVGERSSYLTALQAAMATSPPLDAYLEQIGRVLPQGVWLTSLTLNAPTASTTTPASLQLAGQAFTNAEVAQLLARLELLPSFSKIALANVAQTTVGTKTIEQFTISATPVAPSSTTTAEAPGVEPPTDTTTTSTTPTTTTP
jgi:Tfp pilus assembly protein PilN